MLQVIILIAITHTFRETFNFVAVALSHTEGTAVNSYTHRMGSVPFQVPRKGRKASAKQLKDAGAKWMDYYTLRLGQGTQHKKIQHFFK